MSKRKPKYDVNYFLNKFESIPGKQWTTREYENAAGQRCALGHCQSSCGRPSREHHALNRIFRQAGDLFYGASVAEINDAPCHYRRLARLGCTPKTRIINALTLIGAGVHRDFR